MDEIRQSIKEYLNNKMGIYSFIAALFALGVLIGALTVRGLEESHSAALSQYFNLFLENYGAKGILDQGAVFRQSLRLNFQYLLLTSVLGLFSFGFPFIAGLTVLRGFSVGFTVGFLVEWASFRGVLFAVGSVLPHNLIIIPVIIVLSVTGFSLSWLRFRSYLQKRSGVLRERIGAYMLLVFFVSLALFLGILVEAYISPVFVKLLVPMIAS